MDPSLLFLLLLFGVGYFVIVRPQQKRQKERAALLSSIDVGDDVVTIGGLHGRIEDMTDTTVDLAIAEDATGDPVLLRFDRQAIARVVPVAAPARSEAELLADDDVADDLSDTAVSDTAVSDTAVSENAVSDGERSNTVDVTDTDANADRD